MSCGSFPLRATWGCCWASFIIITQTIQIYHSLLKGKETSPPSRKNAILRRFVSFCPTMTCFSFCLSREFYFVLDEGRSSAKTRQGRPNGRLFLNKTKMQTDEYCRQNEHKYNCKLKVGILTIFFLCQTKLNEKNPFYSSSPKRNSDNSH